MASSCELTLIAAPEESAAAQAAGLPVAHLAYRVGSGPHLFRANLPVAARGGLLAADCRGFDGRGEPSALCQEILRECSARGFTGVYCGFEGRPFPLLRQAAAELEDLLERRGWPLYVPEAYAHGLRRARVLIPTALSGGSLEQRLSDAEEHFGRERVTLAVERVAMDFFLPSPTGQGVPLSREKLRARLEELHPTVYFSRELCAHYFTYMSKENGVHFVLYDDAGSIRKKLDIAGRMGITRAFLPYGQADDLLPRLLKP
ncbi:MAG: hypothetical protein MR648_09365 [Clostridiales bacterium]|nr:hypothetical protein [Clostridiales bacterium]